MNLDTFTNEPEKCKQEINGDFSDGYLLLFTTRDVVILQKVIFFRFIFNCSKQGKLRQSNTILGRGAPGVQFTQTATMQ